MTNVNDFAALAGSCVVGMFALDTAMKNHASKPVIMSEWYEIPMVTSAILGGIHIGGLIGEMYPNVVITGVCFMLGWEVGDALNNCPTPTPTNDLYIPYEYVRYSAGNRGFFDNRRAETTND